MSINQNDIMHFWMRWHKMGIEIKKSTHLITMLTLLLDGKKPDAVGSIS